MPEALRVLVERVAELERRQANAVRFVTVKERHDDGTVTVSDGADFEPSPMGQMSLSAGGWKVDAPADIGTQGLMLCPDGDPSLARFLPCLPSDAHPAASQDPKTMRLRGPAGEVLTITNGTFRFVGDVYVDGELHVDAGATLHVTGDGVLATGGDVVHNTKSIGDTHEHTDVFPGSANTGPPA